MHIVAVTVYFFCNHNNAMHIVLKLQTAQKRGKIKSVGAQEAGNPSCTGRPELFIHPAAPL